MVPGYSTSSNECIEAPPTINTSCGAPKTAENGVTKSFSAVCPSYWRKITLGGSTLEWAIKFPAMKLHRNLKDSLEHRFTYPKGVHSYRYFLPSRVFYFALLPSDKLHN